MLPDLLAPNLGAVFCGTAASSLSAHRGAYYAGPGNAFWPTLQAVGLTPRLFAPEEFPSLLGLGLGLTDLAKFSSGMDAAIGSQDYDASAFWAKMDHYRPGVIAFTSKRAARTALAGSVEYGFQEKRNDHYIYVLPSPSGAARGHWEGAWWLALSRVLSSKGS